jgi:hypothetical protein
MALCAFQLFGLPCPTPQPHRNPLGQAKHSVRSRKLGEGKNVKNVKNGDSNSEIQVLGKNEIPWVGPKV